MTWRPAYTNKPVATMTYEPGTAVGAPESTGATGTAASDTTGVRSTKTSDEVETGWTAGAVGERSLDAGAFS